MASANRQHNSRILPVVLLGAVAAFVCRSLAALSFVQGPASHPAARQPPRRIPGAPLQASSATVDIPASAPAASAPSSTKEPAAPKDGEKEIDDAVLKMAMAMAEEEESAPKEKQPADEGFDWNILVSGFWIFLIIYSFGSVIIGITQGRIQDRTGGDFTAYDFFDNIFSFKEWDIEYTLGFNPVKVLEDAKSKLGL